MANYELEPALLKDFIPYKTELDLHDSRCFVSLVGFMFLDTKVLGITIPFHKNFEEVNLRFYVKYKSDGVWKRGVTFIKEIVPKFLIRAVANNLYSEKYDSMPMKNSLRITKDKIYTGYLWKHKSIWNYLKAESDKKFFFAEKNSAEEFITEHYWGYTKVNNDITSEYQVEHPKWKLHTVKNYDIKCDFGELYGKKFSFMNTTRPASIFLADGSQVIVRKGTTL